MLPVPRAVQQVRKQGAGCTRSSASFQRMGCATAASPVQLRSQANCAGSGAQLVSLRQHCSSIDERSLWHLGQDLAMLLRITGCEFAARKASALSANRESVFRLPIRAAASACNSSSCRTDAHSRRSTREGSAFSAASWQSEGCHGLSRKETRTGRSGGSDAPPRTMSLGSEPRSTMSAAAGSTQPMPLHRTAVGSTFKGAGCKFAPVTSPLLAAGSRPFAIALASLVAPCFEAILADWFIMVAAVCAEEAMRFLINSMVGMCASSHLSGEAAANAPAPSFCAATLTVGTIGLCNWNTSISSSADAHQSSSTPTASKAESSTPQAARKCCSVRCTRCPAPS
mmetsp:Transcript_1209/g.3194  ORF Transcript_1209/g.3194 Transcript_1209/m.3194 type:complete len:341 (-) Transcript_1209:848-1870(-)